MPHAFLTANNFTCIWTFSEDKYHPVKPLADRPSQAVGAAMQQQSWFFRSTIGVWGECWCGWHVTVGHGAMPFYLPCMAAVLWHFSNRFSFSNFLCVPTRSEEVSTCQSSCDLHHSPVLDCTALCSPSTLGFTCRPSGTNRLSAVSLTLTLTTVLKSLPSTTASLEQKWLKQAGSLMAKVECFLTPSWVWSPGLHNVSIYRPIFHVTILIALFAAAQIVTLTEIWWR